MPGPIYLLPVENLEQVLVHVKFRSRASLHKCLLVNRAWYQIVVPIFYSTVVLGNDNVSIFTATHSARYYTFIRSLTIRVDISMWCNLSLSDITWEDSLANAVKTSRKLQELTHILPRLSNLTTFSLYVDEEGRSIRRPIVSVTKRCLVELLRALPPTCIDLEIDTRGLESYEVRGVWDDGHLLNFSNLQPISMLSLKTFIIDAHTTFDGLPAALPCSPKVERLWGSKHESMFYQALQHALKCKSCIPSDSDIYIIFSCPQNSDAGIKRWHGIARTRVNDGTTLATPFIKGRKLKEGDSTNQYLVRIEDQQYLTDVFSEVVQLAEGQLWKDFEGGERLPRAVLSDNCQDYHKYCTIT
ncbi:hypothetical protein GQ53DRAFT_808052 [Thozetella sp. PMI_491]|nr:hypothetical protein GQ53DRAFT_808052 [Thozetella sp. PMI_491]